MSKRKTQPDAFGAITNPGGRTIEVTAPYIEWVTWAQNALYSHDDMLAALQMAADVIKGFDLGDPKTETGWRSEELLDVWMRINAAIAKAEGTS